MCEYQEGFIAKMHNTNNKKIHVVSLLYGYFGGATFNAFKT